MATENSHLPDPDDPLMAPFWHAARESQLTVQRCLQCGQLRWPPTANCPSCLATSTEWTAIEPVGHVWSIATYHRALHPAFKDQVPYHVVMVELSPTVQMVGMVVAGEPAPKIGDRVEARFELVSPDVTLVKWALCSRRP